MTALHNSNDPTKNISSPVIDFRDIIAGFDNIPDSLAVRNEMFGKKIVEKARERIALSGTGIKEPH